MTVNTAMTSAFSSLQCFVWLSVSDTGASGCKMIDAGECRRGTLTTQSVLMLEALVSSVGSGILVTFTLTDIPTH
jgi:hypothetical protein